MALTLVIGNKNYSSWSFRPWIAMRPRALLRGGADLARSQDFKERVLKMSATGKVPVLIDGDIHVWESLAIMEYLAENSRMRSCGRQIPLRARTPARSRRRCTRASSRCGGVPDELSGTHRRRIRRRMTCWRMSAGSTRCGPTAASGSGRAGRSCAGHSVRRTRCTRRWCRAFTPTASRSAPPARAYMDAMMALPAWKEWRAAALKEPWVLPHDEPEWPNVPKLQ